MTKVSHSHLVHRSGMGMSGASGSLPNQVLPQAHRCKAQMPKYKFTNAFPCCASQGCLHFLGFRVLQCVLKMPTIKLNAVKRNYEETRVIMEGPEHFLSFVGVVLSP